MKHQLLVVACALSITLESQAQKSEQAFPDSSLAREYVISPIVLQGELENPGPMNLSELPLHSVPVKELAVDDSGKEHFRGAFAYTGYALYDILKSAKVKKQNEKEFGPSTDLYVVIENERGQKATFSWGEILSAKDRYQVIVALRVESINPAKLKTRWPLPQESRLICADDLSDARFIPNPNKITVHSFSGAFAKEKPEELYSSSIEVATSSVSFSLKNIEPSAELRTYSVVGYGHGMGYKGMQSVRGYVLRDLLAERLKLTREGLMSSIVVISAKDGYRAVFSASEIFNRGDNEEFLLMDRKDSKKEGRFTLFATPDFFVDRNVKAIEKIQLVGAE